MPDHERQEMQDEADLDTILYHIGDDFLAGFDACAAGKPRDEAFREYLKEARASVRLAQL